MSIDLCSGHLTNFVLSELRPVVSRHPRFRDNDGSALTAFSNLIMYRDVSMEVGSLHAMGDKQSPDHYVACASGRATVAKLDGKNGTFIEWIQETDRNQLTPSAGVYYLGIDTIDPATGAGRAILQTYRWCEGCRDNGQGSKIFVKKGINLLAVAPTDPAVEFRVLADSLVILTYTPTLELINRDTNTLMVPGTDWWTEPWVKLQITTTTGGAQAGIALPPGFTSFQIVDQDGYVLRPDIDWSYSVSSSSAIQLPTWTPAGTLIYIEGTQHQDPSVVSYVNPENLIPVSLGVGESLAPDQTFLYSLHRSAFDPTAVVWNGDGTATLKNLMDIGDTLRWNIRIQEPQVFVPFKKMARNPNLLPGLDVMIGDQVEVGDQLAILVFPEVCEIYEIYGAKEGINFDITVKSNDLLTSTELAGLVKTFMLIEGRSRLEACGLTVMSIANSYAGSARDSSGTAATHSVVLSVTAAADWEVHVPLINRVAYIDLEGVSTNTDYLGKPVTKVSAFGLTSFIPYYQ